MVKRIDDSIICLEATGSLRGIMAEQPADAFSAALERIDRIDQIKRVLCSQELPKSHRSLHMSSLRNLLKKYLESGLREDFDAMRDPALNSPTIFNTVVDEELREIVKSLKDDESEDEFMQSIVALSLNPNEMEELLRGHEMMINRLQE